MTRVGPFASRIILITLLSALFLFILLSISQPTAKAETIWKTEGFLQIIEYDSRAVDAKAGDTIRVVFESDYDVDLFFVNEENYNDYTRIIDVGYGSFEYYIQGSVLRTNSSEYSFTVPGEQDYYFIIDNTYMPDDGAPPIGVVSYSIEMTREGFDVSLFWVTCGLVTIIVMVLVLAIVYLIVFKKRIVAQPTPQSTPLDQELKKKEVTFCPACNTLSSRGDFCTKCGRRLR